jgi:hypothetical protein
MFRKAIGSAATVIALAATFAQTALAVSDPAPLPRPEAINQPVTDGCQRNPAGLLAFVSPEWVYVYSHDPSNPNPSVARVAEGTISDSHLAGGDLPQSHDWYDYNADLALDPNGPQGYLIGGNPSNATGNFGDNGQLHLEWESGTVPQYEWATPGDNAKVWGSWIWDCGHWGQSFSSDPDDPAGTFIGNSDYFLPGTGQNAAIRGEGTEFHPMQAMAVRRHNPYRPVVGETETDAFASSNGNIAGATERCALQNPANNPASYPPQYVACSNNPAEERQPVNDRDYSFFIPAPPKPSPTAQLRVRVVDMTQGNGPQERIVPTGNGVVVTIPFQGFGNNTQALSYGKSIFVGWDGAVQDISALIRVNLGNLTVNNSLDDPRPPDTSTGVPPGEYGLYLDVNGHWQYLNDTAAGLGSVLDGQKFNLNQSLDLNVPAGGGVRLFGTGRECDLPRINPCPATPEAAEDNDTPGDATDTFGSVDSARGAHTLTASTDFWQMDYHVDKLRDAHRGLVTCDLGVDTFTPRSKIKRKRSHISPHGIRLRGKVKDLACLGRRQHVQKMEASVARALKKPPVSTAAAAKGSSCRFLQANGRFSARRSCTQVSYVPARGVSRWRFKRKLKLRPGRYIVRSRGTDPSGNVELPRKKGNRLKLKLR